MTPLEAAHADIYFQYRMALICGQPAEAVINGVFLTGVVWRHHFYGIQTNTAPPGDIPEPS